MSTNIPSDSSFIVKYLFWKRVIDLIGSFSLLMLFSPVIFIISFILFIANKGTVFFIQPRAGIYGRQFYILKFKTMTDEKYKNGRLLSDFERTTFIGKILRESSLDELPQLFNVIKGDLSLVGPRPLLMDYLPRYSKEQSMRHLIKPGITGWAQINGRNKLSWEEKFTLDIYYLQNLSLLLDIQILLRTTVVCFNGNGVNASSTETMKEFCGS